MGKRKHITVEKKIIGEGFPVFIIAEIGASHQGDVNLATRLIETGARCGVDAIKLQTVSAEESYIPGEESYEIFKGLWFEYEELLTLKKAAEDSNVVLFSTPGDLLSLDLILRLEMPMIKVSSGLLTHDPLIQRIARSGFPVLLSTGMSFLDEVGYALRILEENGCKQNMLMHCTSLYPSPPDRLNLRAIMTLSDAFLYPVGYSDHSQGTTAAIAACVMGANLIEKHLVLDKKIKLPDSAFALDPKEMILLVEQIRKVEKMLGSSIKEPVEEERGQRRFYRRCLVARKDMKAGDSIDEFSVVFKRPRKGERGLPPSYFDNMVGKQLLKDIEKNELFSFDHFCVKGVVGNSKS